MNKLKPTDLFFLILLVVGILSFFYLAAPEVNYNQPLNFNFENAESHLKIVAAEPHPIGTKEHKKVSDYLREQIIENGFEYSFQKDIVVNRWGSSHQLVSIHNHLALHKGSQSDGIVVFVAHYDSQPNTPGAADDGSPVSCMLSLMEAIKDERHDNDVLFLFTDGEEMGLNGAKYFVENYARKNEIKYLFNFEARGNSGPVLAFETTENNNKLIKDLAQLDHVYASSLMYEVYKILPNDSDFSYFKELDIAGINFAMIDGFVNYHSMTDTPENIDKNAHFHHGILMTQLLSKYKDGSLSQSHEHDLSYFNIFGSGIISYKPIWNLILWMASLLLFVVYIIKTPMKKLSTKQVFASILVTITILIFVILASAVFNFLILKLYPHYANFYSNNFYNGPIYLIPFLGISLLITLGIVRFAAEKDPIIDQLIHYNGIALFLILGIVSYIFVISGSNLFIIPLFWFLAIQVIAYFILKKSNPFVHLISAIVPVVLWIPQLYLFFVAFSLSNPFISVFLMSLLILLIYPAMKSLNRAWMWLFLGMIVLGMIRAHGTSGISKTQPYQAQIFHHTNSILGESLLVSKDEKIDFFEKQFFTNPESKPLYKGALTKRLTNATDLRFPNPLIHSVQRDTLDGLSEQISLFLNSEVDLISVRLSMNGVDELYLNDKLISNDKNAINLEYLGHMKMDTLTISFDKKLRDRSEVIVRTTQRGLIPHLDQSGMIIPGPNNIGGAIIHRSKIEI